VLPIALPETHVDQLFQNAAQPGYELTIDLEACEIRDDAGLRLKFEIDPFRQHCLLNGLDDIALTLEHADAIADYEQRHAEQLARK
jgi:3-isopropylmalate/(R)-2-methylmalate dehydratase small subunit